MLNKYKRFFSSVLYPKNLFKNIFFQLTISIFVILSIFLLESILVENVNEKYDYIPSDSFYTEEYDLDLSDIPEFEENSKFNKIGDSVFLNQYLSNTYSYFSSRGTVSITNSKTITTVNPIYCDNVKKIGSYLLRAPVTIVSENDSDGIYIHEVLFKELFGDKSIESDCYLNFYQDMFNTRAYQLKIKGIYTYETKKDYFSTSRIFLPNKLFPYFISTDYITTDSHVTGGIINVFNKDIDKDLNEAINKVDQNGTTKFKSVKYEKDNYNKVFNLIGFILLGTMIVMSTSIGFLEFNRINCRSNISKINLIYYKKKHSIIIENLLNFITIFVLALLTAIILVGLIELVYFLLYTKTLEISSDAYKYIIIIFASGFITNIISNYSNFFQKNT